MSIKNGRINKQGTEKKERKKERMKEWNKQEKWEERKRGEESIPCNNIDTNTIVQSTKQNIPWCEEEEKEEEQIIAENDLKDINYNKYA